MAISVRRWISLATVRELGLHPGRVLDPGEVAAQRGRFGQNDITEVSGHPGLELLRDTLRDPMIWFLAAIGSAFVLVGKKMEAWTSFVAILPLVSMDAFLHRRTQVSTRGLKSQFAAQCRVIRRDSQGAAAVVSIPAREIVPGDLVQVEAGEHIPADGFWESVAGVQVDEALLTGESAPVGKDSAALVAGEWLREAIFVEPSMLGQAGTRCLTGRGLLRVLAIGNDTSYGEILGSVAELRHSRTPMQKIISRIVRVQMGIAAVFCGLLAGVRLAQGHGWLDAILSGATLAVAALPEEFPLVFSFFLGVGVYRLARDRALVRHAVSVENIGRTTHICSDKTGTITEGRLRLVGLEPAPGVSESRLLWSATQASNPEAFDPVDVAIREKVQGTGGEALASFERLALFPFTEDRKREVALIREASGLIRASMKGAPETVVVKTNLSEDEAQVVLSRVRELASKGRKVLACASIDASERLQEPEGRYQFLGLLAFEDPPREKVREAMEYCMSRGIRVLMLTGDHPETARAVALEVGIGRGAPVVVSAEPEWSEPSSPDFSKVDVVARCRPLQKLAIVQGLQRLGAVVAVTGDGVNDVPALKAADIGVAMGGRGTRGAREVASIVLADDHFGTIVKAIREGRQLFRNLRDSFEYLILVHLPFVLTAAVFPLLGNPVLYLPIHIVWIELIIHPTSLLAFQKPVSDQSGARDFRFLSVADSLHIGISGGLFSLLLSWRCLQLAAGDGALPLERIRGLALGALSLWSVLLVVVIGGVRTRAAALSGVGTLLVAACFLRVEFFQRWLEVGRWHGADFVFTILAVSVSAGVLAWLRACRGHETPPESC